MSVSRQTLHLRFITKLAFKVKVVRSLFYRLTSKLEIVGILGSFGLGKTAAVNLTQATRHPILPIGIHLFGIDFWILGLSGSLGVEVDGHGGGNE